MTSKNGMNALLFAAALVLAGAGCNAKLGSDASVDTGANAPSGATVEAQADIVVDEAMNAMSGEDEASADVEGDAQVFVSDEEELDQYENSYDEGQL